MIILTTNRIQLIDNKVLNFCSIKLKNKYFDRTMPFITHSNDFGLIYVSLILFSIIFKYRTDVATKLFIALALGFTLGEGLLLNKDYIENHKIVFYAIVVTPYRTKIIFTVPTVVRK